MNSIICVECNSIFARLSNLKVHVNRKHPEKAKDFRPKIPKYVASTKCAECNIHFSKVSNLRSHVRKKHPDKVSILCPKRTFKVVATCQICQQTFARKDNLRAHIQKKHFGEASLNGNECSYCGKVFESKTNLKEHCKTHNTKDSFKCPLCNYSNSKQNLIQHYEICHNIKVEFENLEFSSMEEFSQWKQKLETETTSSFTKNHGSYKTESAIKCRYVCHRSGTVRLRGQHLRRLKTQGSNKINGYCPSCIEVSEENGKCKVRFVKTHVGHQLDLEHIFLNPLERQQLASKIATGVPFRKILDEVRESISSNTGSRRLHLLKKKDLHNIKQCCQLNSKAVRNVNNAVRIEASDVEMHES